MKCKVLIFFLLTFYTSFIQGQNIDQSYILELKEYIRGPYVGIRWFCEDGSMRDARDPCPEPMEGVQHAIYADKVKRLADNKHIFLDQILTGTKTDDFWDLKNQNSRLKQFQLTNFLFDADEGWILQKAKEYRGAKQIEDEQDWGQSFLEWLCQSKSRIEENYLLIKLAANDVPHGKDTRVAQRVRAYSKLLAETEPTFMNLRIRIHNNPTKSDLPLVVQFKKDKPNITPKSKEYLELLLDDMKILYKPFDVDDINDLTKGLSNKGLINKLTDFTSNLTNSSTSFLVMQSCELLPYLRDNLLDENLPTGRVKILDIINQLEKVIIQNANTIDQSTLYRMREKLCFLGEAVYGAGYVEQWEYNMLKNDIDWLQKDDVNFHELDYYRQAAQKWTQWGSQMLQSLYGETVSKFSEFEPLSHGFVDDKIRSSVILPIGQLVEQLNVFYSAAVENKSVIFDNKNVSGMMGLNPGLAKGRLKVLTSLPENMDLDKNTIYAFDRPPADMKPVAGILNVKEGNPVSHVQLLARNLAIPNALISLDMLNHLKKYDGKEVFYAVSPKGTIMLKEADELSDEEQKLFTKAAKKKGKITIATDKLNLDADRLLDISQIDASYSGKWCGPKAANLAQLKIMFPENVVDGFVIPFGVFKDHMLQIIPGQSISYWDFLKNIFKEEKTSIANNEDAKVIEKTTLNKLSELRGLIEEMPLKTSLVNNVEEHFIKILGSPLGKVPVFLRSDTNMEDLPQFTGAGLNLTLFNILDRAEILNGINKVWASPYTERSYQWRQQYLENPEDVYPSILIIPSVNVDRSGVIITKGVTKGGENDVSISFSRGVGGAVEGQAAESYIIYKNGYAELISPGRETKYRTIPSSGGSTFEYTSFKTPVLNLNQRYALYRMANTIATKLDETQGKHTAYDIELGIKDDHIWLFQVRPFVENKDALSSDYLMDLDPPLSGKRIML